MLNLLPTYVSSGTALFIAAGGIWFQVWRDRRQKRQQEREAIERLLKQKVEEYFLKAEDLFHIFNKWQNRLSAANTDVQEIKDEYLTVEAFLTMLETLYFPSFKNEHYAASLVGSRLFKDFQDLAKKVLELKVISGTGTIGIRQEDIQSEWTAVRDRYLKEADEVRQFLEGLDLYELCSEHMSIKDKKVLP